MTGPDVQQQMAEVRRCEWCGREFTPPHSRGPKPKFCSAGHRQRAFLARREARLVDALQAILDAAQTGPPDAMMLSIESIARHALREVNGDARVTR